LKERNTKPVTRRLEVIGQRSETVRRANLGAIVRELHAAGPLSRSELVGRTDLTRSAIRGLIGELTTAGLVFEARAAPQGTPGRPSPLVSLDPRGAVVLALEIAVDSLAVAVVGLGGTVFELARIDRPTGHASVEAVTADLAELAASAIARHRHLEPFLGVGVSVVGVVRRSDGFVSMAPNLGWRNIPLGEELATALHLTCPLSIANEADLGALVEHRRGAAMGLDDVLFVSGEYGVGGGLIAGGRPLTGAAGYSGEIGHLAVNPNGTACRCGSVGCWETEVGEAALLRLAGHPPGGGRGEIDAVLDEAEAGSPSAISALDQVGRWLGVGLAGLINVLNPELVILGGLFGRIHPFVSKTLDDELDRRTLTAPRALVQIVPATLGVDAPLLGAAELAFEPLLIDPAFWMASRDRSADLASA
jgi:predicted NBD/HSP70 family sugar kinase